MTYGDAGTTEDYWQGHLTSRTFELRDIGYNNNYGGNWRSSCTPNIDGTPGKAPETCTSTDDDSCSETDSCDLNGGSGSCALSADYCTCESDYLEDSDACIESMCFFGI